MFTVHLTLLTQMSTNLDIPIRVIAFYALGLILLYIIGWILLVPLRTLFKFFINGIIGGVVLWLLNMGGTHIGIVIGINPVTALVVGFLGLPGVVLLILLQLILV